MEKLDHLFQSNRAWAERVVEAEPNFFAESSRRQSPAYLWIGCSDSRVPATQLLGLSPGEVFVHRNIANVIAPTDLNCLSVMQFAVDVLKVRHIIVCGHYGCGGVRAALRGDRVGLCDHWLQHVRGVRDRHESLLANSDAEMAADRLCELNVIEQVGNVCQTTIVQDAWARGQELTVHGWIYNLRDGLLRDLGLTITSAPEIAPAQEAALAAFS